MSTESNYNSGNLVYEGNNSLNNTRRMQQQQAQLLFRQRQLQQQQQRTLPPTPTLSSQGSPAFSQVVQTSSQVYLPIKSIITPTAATKTTTTQRTSSMGQAVLRLLQFRDQLSPGDQAKDVSFWRSFVDDFFTTSAIMKIGLLDNNTQQKNEFEITQSLIARFFHTHYQCELESMQLTTDQTMEYFLPTGMILECPRSSLIHRYNNGTLVILSGELSVLFNLDPNDGLLKIHQWKFSCNQHDEYITRSKLVSVDVNAASKKKLKSLPKTPTFHTPPTLVNNWGLPERIYQLLRIIDTSTRLGEVAFFSLVTGQNPKDALTAMSFAINQQMLYSYPEDQRQIKENVTSPQDIPSSPLLATDILSLLPPAIDQSPFMSNNLLTSTTPTPTIISAPPLMINSPLNMSSQPSSNMISQAHMNSSNNMSSQTPNNMNPQTPNNMNPQTPNNMNPQTPNIMNPQTPNNMHPQTPNNMHPQTPNNMHPQTPNINPSNNMNSHMNSQPPMNPHMNPQSLTPQALNNMMPMNPQPLHAQVISNMNSQPVAGMMTNPPGMMNSPNYMPPQGMMPPHGMIQGLASNHHPQQSTQFMQQQAAMQRYYQQQNLRMQHQQQALQIQQRQAMQRLQQPFTAKVENLLPQTPPATTDDKISRKRKMSLPKDVKKPTAVKKGKK